MLQKCGGINHSANLSSKEISLRVINDDGSRSPFAVVGLVCVALMKV